MKFYLYIVLVLSVIITSCSLEKRQYNKGFYFSRNNKLQSSASSVKSIDKPSVITEIKHQESQDDGSVEQKISKTSEALTFEPAAKDSNECDQIVFHDSREESVIVKEVTPTEIKYKKCGFEEGPLYTVDPTSVSVINYRNGTKEYYGSYVKPKLDEDKSNKIDHPTSWANDPREVEIFSVLSFASSLIVMFPGIALVSIVLGIIGLRMFKKEPGKFKGRGFAIAGIWIGVLTILTIVLLFLFI